MDDALVLDGESIDGFLKRVLILVVMDDALVLAYDDNRNVSRLISLNPCCNG